MDNIILDGVSANVGDRVQDKSRGLGRIAHINSAGTYRIIVEWDDKNLTNDSYTIDGRLFSSANPTLKRYIETEFRYLGQIGNDFFITDYFRNKKDAEKVIIDAAILREIPESERVIK